MAMRSYAAERERHGPMPWVLSAPPARTRDSLDWWPTLRMAAQLSAVCGAGFVFLKIIGAA